MGVNPQELADESYTFLETVLWEAYEKRDQVGDLREAFVFRHGRNVQAIARDVFFLYTEGRYTAATIAIRSMIESMFCVAASFHVKTFPEEKTVAECDKMVKRIRKLAETQGIGDLTEAVTEYGNLAAKVREQYSVKTNKEWNIFDMAQAGKLEGQYSSDYFLHCGYVHATLTGIISLENNAALGHSYQTAIAVVIITAAHLAMQLETRTPQSHVDNSSKLLGIS